MIPHLPVCSRHIVERGGIQCAFRRTRVFRYGFRPLKGRQRMVILLTLAIEAAQFITDGHNIFHIVLRAILFDTIQQEGLHFNGITAAAAVIELLIELIESALRNDPLLPLFCKNYTIDSIWMVCCFSCELCRLRHILFRAMDRKMRFGKKQVKTGTFCTA